MRLGSATNFPALQYSASYASVLWGPLPQGVSNLSWFQMFDMLVKGLCTNCNSVFM